MTTEKPRKSRSKYSRVTHPFLYEVELADGKKIHKKAKALVKYATKPVELSLTAAHVQRSINLGGVGHTSKCAVAICALRHADKFPHIVEGHIDFQYSRAYVVTHLNKYGLPAKCVCYEHDVVDIAKLNDSPNGQQKLLDKIDKHGPMAITLRPYRKRSDLGRPGSHRAKTGARDKVVPKGARLRYATMKLGALPSV